MSRRARSLLRNPSSRSAKWAIGAGLLMLVAAVPPGGYTLLLMPLLLIWLVIGLRWFFGCFLFYLVAWYYQQPFLLSRRAFQRWTIIPAATAATMILLEMDVPSRLHFMATRHSLERLAQRAVRGQSVGGDHWVGLVKVGDIRSHGGDVEFTVRGTGPLWRSGFIYHPSGRPRDQFHYYYSRLSGDWYAWVDMF